MDDQSKNLIIATALSFLVILGWFFLFPPEQPTPTTAPTQTAQQDGTAAAPATTDGAAGTPQLAAPAGKTIGEALALTERVPIATGALEGSISLVGGRIDFLELKRYTVTVEPNSPIVTLLRPAGDQP